MDGGAVHEGRTGFLHGVASFDPLPDGVLIWTRLTPLRQEDVVVVAWEVSAAADFGSIAASGEVSTDESRDWTVTVGVQGLQPMHRYYYRFTSGKLRSPNGMTKTTTAGPLDELTFAAVSCSNWGYGYFNVYDLLSKVDNLDFVLHCGDYVYEYPKGEYPGRRFMARHGLRPKHKCGTLGDYRQRYACYRTDPALQELHRRLPFIVVNDDHEIQDSANTKTAEEFNGSPAEYERKKRAAIQAFTEWVPVRGATHASVDLAAVHRRISFGDLATLLLVENRVSHRSPEVDMPSTQFYKETAQKDLKEWNDDAIHEAKDELMRQLADPDRSLIGKEQLRDVAEWAQQSVSAGQPWQIFLSQTVLSPLRAPKLLETVWLQPKWLSWVCRKALGVATNVKRAGKEGAELARMYLGMGRYGVPMNPGAYDGYAAERDKLLRAVSLEGGNLVVLAGDSHNAWAHDLLDRDGNRLGVEFDSPAITSVGAFEDIYLRFADKAGRLAHLFPLWLFTPWIEDALLAANPDSLWYCDLNHRGCVLCHVTHAKWHSEYHYVSTVSKREYTSFCGAVFEVEAGQPGRLRKGVRYMTIEGEIPQQKQGKRKTFLRSSRKVSRSAPARW